MDQLWRFLIVDDDPIFLAVAEAAVRELGAREVVAAADGRAGLNALRQATAQFDLIILDLNMPEIDGLAFLRGASEAGFRGGLIISSGESDAVLSSAQLMGRLLRIRVLGALKKPLSPQALGELLAATANESRERSVSSPGPSVRLEDLELVPYFQAQHKAADASIGGLEALIRARTPNGDIVGPDRLFGLVRGHSELVTTTLAIARKVLAEMREWRIQGICPRISINLDASVAEDPAAAAALLEIISKSGIPPELVCLELTETALPSDMTMLIENLARFRIRGLQLSIDDYGTGGSNFELLRHCPFSELKIDGSVMRSAADERVASRFVRSTVATARDLNLEVIGEGVETCGQLEAAKANGIQVIQGYVFSRPLPAEKIRPFLDGSQVFRAAV